MGLEKYQKKRKFSKTPEPPPYAKASGGKKGEVGKKDQQRFVVQKHQARTLHYDFRLEMEGVLKSWAVPKGVPTQAGVKHLAVAVEDHPVDYLNFKGVIPEGNYGAGKVEIWDKGKYEMIEKKSKFLKFELKGKKLKGKYVLFNFQGKNWFLFKMDSKRIGR